VLQCAFGALGVSYGVFSAWVDLAFVVILLIDFGNAPEDLFRDAKITGWRSPLELFKYFSLGGASFAYAAYVPEHWRSWGAYVSLRVRPDESSMCRCSFFPRSTQQQEITTRPSPYTATIVEGGLCRILAWEELPREELPAKTHSPLFCRP
jgi:hypothetical protein